MLLLKNQFNFWNDILHEFAIKYETFIFKTSVRNSLKSIKNDD